MRAFDNCVLLLVRSDLSAEVFDDGIGRHPKCVCHVIEVCDVGLNAIEARLLLQHHFGHGIPAIKIRSSTCKKGLRWWMVC